jgi:hypothetical protein
MEGVKVMTADGKVDVARNINPTGRSTKKTVTTVKSSVIAKSGSEQLDVLPKNSSIVENRKQKKEEMRRAQVYAMNHILRKLEIEKFEQFKVDVATGKEIVTYNWHSDDSSGTPSPVQCRSGNIERGMENLKIRHGGELQESRDDIEGLEGSMQAQSSESQQIRRQTAPGSLSSSTLGAPSGDGDHNHTHTQSADVITSGVSLVRRRALARTGMVSNIRQAALEARETRRSEASTMLPTSRNAHLMRFGGV